MRRVIPLLLFNVCATEAGLYFQRFKDAIDFRIKNILAIFQINLDFSFKILAVSGKHDFKGSFVWFVFEFSSLYIPLLGALFNKN
jgi:hypothetical protein